MYNFDKIDIKIVNLLLEDGRMPASEIARQPGDISERAVRYRVDRMVNEDIVCISAVARPRAFGPQAKRSLGLIYAVNPFGARRILQAGRPDGNGVPTRETLKRRDIEWAADYLPA